MAFRRSGVRLPPGPPIFEFNSASSAITFQTFIRPYDSHLTVTGFEIQSALPKEPAKVVTSVPGIEDVHWEGIILALSENPTLPVAFAWAALAKGEGKGLIAISARGGEEIQKCDRTAAKVRQLGYLK